ncbi:MAG: DUF6172 family protein [Hylemonella sp.]|nr:DUF6172 family protein [Hylemonella sp.]
MRKTYPLQPEGKHPDRVLEAVKHDIRKYVKRQRRVALPQGVDFWDFDCRVGLSADTAAPVHFGNLIEQIDVAAQAGATAVYVELLVKNGQRQARPQVAGEEGQD